MSMKTRSMPFVGVRSTEDGFVEAYVAIFGAVDSYGTIFRYGCFADSISSRKVRAVWSHDAQRPIGKVVEIREVPAGSDELPDEIRQYGGLYARMHLALNTRDGRDMYEHILFGSVEEFSFAFEEVESEIDSNGRTNFTRATIYEVSPVLIGSNPLTQLVGVRSMSIDQKSQLFNELISELTGHVEAYGDMRVRAGRKVSRPTHSLLSGVAAEMERNVKIIKAFLREHDPDREDEGRSIAQRKLALRSKFGFINIQ